MKWIYFLIAFTFSLMIGISTAHAEDASVLHQQMIKLALKDALSRDWGFEDNLCETCFVKDIRVQDSKDIKIWDIRTYDGGYEVPMSMLGLRYANTIYRFKIQPDGSVKMEAILHSATPFYYGTYAHTIKFGKNIETRTNKYYKNGKPVDEVTILIKSNGIRQKETIVTKYNGSKISTTIEYDAAGQVKKFERLFEYPAELNVPSTHHQKIVYDRGKPHVIEEEISNIFRKADIRTEYAYDSGGKVISKKFEAVNNSYTSDGIFYSRFINKYEEIGTVRTQSTSTASYNPNGSLHHVSLDESRHDSRSGSTTAVWRHQQYRHFYYEKYSDRPTGMVLVDDYYNKSGNLETKTATVWSFDSDKKWSVTYNVDDFGNIGSTSIKDGDWEDKMEGYVSPEFLLERINQESQQADRDDKTIDDNAARNEITISQHSRGLYRPDPQFNERQTVAIPA